MNAQEEHVVVYDGNVYDYPREACDDVYSSEDASSDDGREVREKRGSWTRWLPYIALLLTLIIVPLCLRVRQRRSAHQTPDKYTQRRPAPERPQYRPRYTVYLDNEHVLDLGEGELQTENDFYRRMNLDEDQALYFSEGQKLEKSSQELSRDLKLRSIIYLYTTPR